MRNWFIVICILSISFPAFADDHGDHHDQHHKGGYVEEALSQILDDSKDATLSDITVGDTASLLGTLSIAAQKDMHVKHSSAASFMHPGMGQFMNEDTAGGVLFLSASTVVSVGTVVGAYMVLPDSLKFDQIDYFNDSYASIEAEWMGMSFMDLLPSMGIMAGGILVDLGIRVWSAKNAGMTARERIDSGKIDFEPRLLLMPGGMGMGVKMGKRHK